LKPADVERCACGTRAEAPVLMRDLEGGTEGKITIKSKSKSRRLRKHTDAEKWARAENPSRRSGRNQAIKAGCGIASRRVTKLDALPGTEERVRHAPVAEI
jgi:hypothetical protein